MQKTTSVSFIPPITELSVEKRDGIHAKLKVFSDNNKLKIIEITNISWEKWITAYHFQHPENDRSKESIDFPFDDNSVLIAWIENILESEWVQTKHLIRWLQIGMESVTEVSVKESASY